jgi:hypothetical protein
MPQYSRYLNIFQRILLGIALLMMLGHTVVYLAFGAALIPFPFDYDQAEGFELNNAILFSEGGCPYCDNDIYPFYASGYAPVYHLIMTPFVWVFGAQFWYGRLIVFLATLFTAAAISFAVWRNEKQGLIALLVGLAFLASNFIYHIGPLLRQHLLMVLFETLAVVVVANAFENDKKARFWRIFAACAFLMLAAYTKQLAYTTVIAIFAWIFLRTPRLAIVWSIGLGIVAVLLFGLAMWLTNGQWWVNIISSNQNEYITEQFIGLIRLFLVLHWPLLIMALLFTVYEIYFTRLSVYSIWFLVSFISTIGAGKWGAGDSYFATTLVGACILAGLFLARTLKVGWQAPEKHYLATRIPKLNGQLTGTIALISLVIYGALVFKLPTSGIFEPIARFFSIEPQVAHRYPFYDSAQWTVGYAVTGHFPSEADYEAGWEIVEHVRNTEGLVLSEDAGFEILAGREVITNPVQLRNLWENGLYDPINLLSLIENQEFGLIIRRGNFFPPPILIAMDTYYVLDEAIEMNGFTYTLWIPK